jgi:hypothetical protein
MAKGQKNAFPSGTPCACPHCDRDAERTSPIKTKDGNAVDELCSAVPVCPTHWMQISRRGNYLAPGQERKRRAVPVTAPPTHGDGAPAPAPAPTPASANAQAIGTAWHAVVKAHRQALASTGIASIASTRDVVLGVRALRHCGQTTDQCIEGLLRQGLEPGQWSKVNAVLDRGTIAECERVRKATIKRLPALKSDEPAHRLYGQLYRLIDGGIDVWLHGPSGAGKTALVVQVARAQERTFGATGKLTHESGLSGYIQPHNGQLLETEFRRCYADDANENGSLFLWDDADASNPQAMTWANMALSNGLCPFPDGLIEQRPKFATVFTANTVGHGADSQYIRNAQDSATRKRFFFIHMDYDEELEATIAARLS